MTKTRNRRTRAELIRHPFGEWLLFLRSKQKLNQKELADLTGIPQETIGFWERTGKVRNASRLIALSKALGVSLDTLFGNTIPPAKE